MAPPSKQAGTIYMGFKHVSHSQMQKMCPFETARPHACVGQPTDARLGRHPEPEPEQTIHCVAEEAPLLDMFIHIWIVHAATKC